MFKNLIYDDKEYENFEIDEEGNIRNKKTDCIYKKGINKAGYITVYLPMGKRGKVKCIRVHKAVAETFIPNPNHYPIVNHIDENRANCSLNNLEWTTSKGNIQAHLKICSKKTEYFNNRKFIYEEAVLIRCLKGRINQYELARIFGVSRMTIRSIQNGKTYSNGY